MSSKWAVRVVLAGLLGGLALGATGWIAGAWYGGNYATDFEFNGLRGYEATGPIGALLGFVCGGMVCPYLAGRPNSRATRFLAVLLSVAILIPTIPPLLIYGLVRYRVRWRPKPFDPTIWKSKEAVKNGDRYRMTDDLIRKIRGRSREEVIGLLGEPNRPCPRHYSTAPERSCDLAYFLCSGQLGGGWELLIRLDEQSRVKAAGVKLSD